jgi:hypothetical protein
VERQISLSFNQAPSCLHRIKRPLMFARPSMRSLRSLAALLTICLALPSAAQDRLPAGDPPKPNAAPLGAPAVLTGKERLGRKWMDEQRIDNCKVPIDKRGTRPRPSTCPHVPVG